MFYFCRRLDDDDCDTCAEILEELETIDDDTDKHGIQFVKSNDAKLAAEIGVFSFPALIYYETGVPIMYDGKLGVLHFAWSLNAESRKVVGAILFHFLHTYKNKENNYFYQCYTTSLHIFYNILSNIFKDFIT